MNESGTPSLPRHPTEQLPWLANETLEGEEQARVRAHVAECDRCRAELNFLLAVRKGAKKAWLDETAGELGWARLRAAVRRERRDARFGAARWLAAAAAVVLIIQALVIAQLVGGRQEETLYEPLGARPQAVLQLRFHPQATEARIRAVLREAGVEIVGGPGAFGVYRVAPVQAQDAAALERARRRLQAASDVVAEIHGP